MLLAYLTGTVVLYIADNFTPLGNDKYPLLHMSY